MNRPLGVYVHIPFCATHCAYCHFVIDLQRGAIQEKYVEAVRKEILGWGPRLSSDGPAIVDTVYIGGGTPSWIDSREIVKILETLRESFSLKEIREATIEINPDSLSEQKLTDYLKAGINRVSLGIQSFRDDELRRLGRTHTVKQAREAFAQIRARGFTNISIDLIAGLPGQTAVQWREAFPHIEELQPEHISLYLFDVDEDSFIGRQALQALAPVTNGSTSHSPDPPPRRNRFALPPEEVVIAIYEQAREEFARLGYEQYEISNFARKNSSASNTRNSHRSQHNLKYWNLEPYLGLGCAAHSSLGSARWHNENNTEQYIERILTSRDAHVEIEQIDDRRLAEDAFILGLRQIEGIEYEFLTNRLHRDARSLFRSIIDPLVADGWLIEEAGRLRLAPHSLLVSNEIFQQFLSEH